MSREGSPAFPASAAHLAITAAEVEQRGAFDCPGLDDLSDEDCVIAAGELVVDRALQRGQRPSNQGDTEGSAADFDAREFVVDPRREARGDMALCFGENADAELAGGGDGIVGLHAFLDTDEHERWME